MSKQQAQPGLVELMTYIDSKNLPKGICTRNFDMPVDHLITKFLSAVKPFHPSQYKSSHDMVPPLLCFRIYQNASPQAPYQATY